MDRSRGEFQGALNGLAPQVKRDLGAAQASNAIVAQRMSNGTFEGEIRRCKVTVAPYSMGALKRSMAAFRSIFETGILPTAA
tara:strand:- start:326 stop:571 length:246 start_codon:yes stop_codon:yes gene_type:complete